MDRKKQMTWKTVIPTLAAVTSKMQAGVRDFMSIVELLILIMLTVISAQYAYNLVFSKGVLKIALTDMLRVPKVYTGIAVPIGFGLSTIYSV